MIHQEKNKFNYYRSTKFDIKNNKRKILNLAYTKMNLDKATINNVFYPGSFLLFPIIFGADALWCVIPVVEGIMLIVSMIFLLLTHKKESRITIRPFGIDRRNKNSITKRAYLYKQSFYASAFSTLEVSVMTEASRQCPSL